MADRVRGLRVWHLPVIVWLTIVWLLLWGQISALTLVGGIAVSCLIIAVFPFPRVSVDGRFHPGATCVVVAGVLFDLVVASFQVAWLAVRPAGSPPSAVIRVDLVSGSELRQTLTGELISLVPGSLLIELDSRGRRMWLHVLDASTPRKVEQARFRARMQEHHLVKAIGTDGEIAESERRLREGT